MASSTIKSNAWNLHGSVTYVGGSVTIPDCTEMLLDVKDKSANRYTCLVAKDENGYIEVGSSSTGDNLVYKNGQVVQFIASTTGTGSEVPYLTVRYR